MNPSSDFHFTQGDNHGLGSAYIYVKSLGLVKTSTPYPGCNKFSDEGGSASKGNLLYYIKPDEITNNQYDCFAPNTASGLMQEGLLRVNQLIEALVQSSIAKGKTSKLNVIEFTTFKKRSLGT